MNLLASLAAGLLLATSGPPLQWWPLQLVAFVPWWWAIAARRAAHARVWPLGLLFALGYVAVTLLTVGFAAPILVVAVATLLQWTLATVLAGRLWQRGNVLDALAAAGAVTLVEIALWHLVPMFGTAQCFALPLVDAPWLVAFAAFTGLGGVVFASLALQALLVAALRGERRRAALAAFVVLAVAVAALDVVRWTRALGPAVRVAAFGFAGAPPRADGKPFAERAAVDAAAAGCKLLVTPETALRTGDEREPAIERLGAIARAHGLHAAFGVWHDPSKDNRIWFFDAAGALLGEYTKTHLVPFLEDYAAGDGALAIVPLGDTRLGGMICQDDNFTDLARGYGRAGVPLLAVPTNDWDAIRAFHLQSSAFRAIENGYAIVRAASNGISALVSPRGELLASCDHVERGPQLVVADLPLGDGVPTLYARAGDWLILALGALLVAAAIVARRFTAARPAFTSSAELRQFVADTEAALLAHGLDEAAAPLQHVQATAFTTSSEWLGELAVAARRVAARGDVPPDVRSRLERIRAAVRRSWPGA